MKINKKSLLGGLLVLALTTTGIYAYFTDVETTTNTFTVGKVDIQLTEPNWNENNAKDITPLKEIAKDPKVTNVGINDAFVFLEVEVPYANVVVAEANGTKKVAAETELFSYTVKDGWVELGTGTKANGVVKHVYAYGTADKLTALAKDASTPTLFDSVTFANVVENQNLETTTQKIVITAKAIQTSDINGGITSPSGVLQVINNQVPTNVAN